MMVEGVAATAAVRSWPFRVFSFPRAVVEPNFGALSAATLGDLRSDILYDNFFVGSTWITKLKMESQLFFSHPRNQFHLTNISAPSDDQIAEFAGSHV